MGSGIRLLAPRKVDTLTATLPPTQLSLWNRLYPGNDGITHNIDHADNPKDAMELRTLVACDEQEDDTAQITRRAGDTGDETYELVSRRLWRTNLQ